MGMAASQARYLEITARKTNVEYAGQQINQQRTALANESAGLFTQLMSLQVPTAPSSAQYTTTAYTFSDGDNNYTITDMRNLTGDPDYNKTVTYFYNTTQYTGIARTRSDLGARNLGTPAVPIYWLTDGAGGGTATNKTRLNQCTGTAEELRACQQIVDDNACSANFITDYNAGAGIGNIYYYTDSQSVVHYYSTTDLTAMPANGSAASLTGSYASDLDQKVYQTSDAYVQSSSSGRYSEITLDGYTQSFDLTATTTVDSIAYNNAMNEYEYQMALYQQQVNNINAKTSIIQNEDRTLELQLKQLDTEQEALQTELDAVKKVIDKNIEQTFKTFSS